MRRPPIRISRLLYKYPQREYPYTQLVQENARRSLQQNEFELIDTCVFEGDRYWDVFVEYCKAAPDDILHADLPS
jgi:hypothetical protein